ncbi:MAG: UDP-glucose/GDP-mannose dehydrogenase family protein [Candidatus Omnitrophica bacterium]|nr:UDP-glucose/GDP-mannose dehydrogenase family protein [Candidatus Omnitrophota bacterium]
MEQEILINKKNYNILVIGAGHVGLVTAACFAELGHNVICVDNDRQKIKHLNKLKLPFYEPQLDRLVIKNFKKRLFFSSSLEKNIKEAEIIFIAVGTPPLPDGSADLTSIENIATIIASNLNSYKLIVEKSTVPVHTGKKIKETITKYKKNDLAFDVASNPEFLREGKAIYDFFNPDRIVIGVETKCAEKILKNIYAPFKAPIVVTNINTAELIKHASNSFLATKISFINAISKICDLCGANVKKVADALGLDKRIGKSFLDAGVGYGGFCFPKDLEAFIYISKKLGYDFALLKEVKRINEEQKLYFVEKIKEKLWVLKNKKIAILGLSFKPQTDDMRFAPSIDIIGAFLSEGSIIKAYDPKAIGQAKKIFSKKDNIYFATNPYDAVKNCDCLCLLTEWEEFKNLDFKKIKKLMNTALIADGRNFLDKEKLQKIGFDYIGLGV